MRSARKGVTRIIPKIMWYISHFGFVRPLTCHGHNYGKSTLSYGVKANDSDCVFLIRASLYFRATGGARQGSESIPRFAWNLCQAKLGSKVPLKISGNSETDRDTYRTNSMRNCTLTFAGQKSNGAIGQAWHLTCCRSLVKIARKTPNDLGIQLANTWPKITAHYADAMVRNGKECKNPLFSSVAATVEKASTYVFAERLIRNAEVEGSNPFCSTKLIYVSHLRRSFSL